MSTENLTPEGRYRAICRSVQFGQSKKGDEQVAIGFEFLDEAGQPANVHMTYFGMFGDNSIDFTVEALRNCGWSGDDLAELPALAESGGLASEVQLVVVHETYEGVRRAKVKFVNRAGGGKIKLERPLDSSSLSSFAQRMRSKVRAAGRDNAPRSTRPPASSNGRAAPGGGYDGRDVPPPVDDDIPFATCSLAAEPSPIARVLR